MYSTKKRHYFPSLFTLLSDRVSLAKYCFQKSFSFWRQMRLFLLLLSLRVRSNFLNRPARSIVSSAFPFGLSKHQMSPFQYIEEKTMHFETVLWYFVQSINHVSKIHSLLSILDYFCMDKRECQFRGCMHCP